jgi:hypothetical protein
MSLRVKEIYLWKTPFTGNSNREYYLENIPRDTTLEMSS